MGFAGGPEAARNGVRLVLMRPEDYMNTVTVKLGLKYKVQPTH